MKLPRQWFIVAGSAAIIASIALAGMTMTVGPSSAVAGTSPDPTADPTFDPCLEVRSLAEDVTVLQQPE